MSDTEHIAAQQLERARQGLGVVAGLDPTGPEFIAQHKGAFGVQGSGDTSGFGEVARTEVLASPATRPYGEWFDDAVDVLGEALSRSGSSLEAAVEKVVVEHGELTLFVRRAELLHVLLALRDDPDLRFELSLGVSGVHYPENKGRELHALYHLLSITHGSRWLRLEVTAPDDDPVIPSSVAIYPTNNWHERETWDMFGIRFAGHPSLARILMPDDWVGHPQRKDYPLGGVAVEYKGASIPPADNRRAYN